MKFFVWRLWISEDFLKTLKVNKLVWPWRLGIHSRNMKHEAFCFRSFIFSCLSHRKHRTVKGGRGNTKENFQLMLNSKASTYPILRVKPLEISCSSVKFFSERDDDLLVSEEIGLTEELGFSQCELPSLRNMIAMRNLWVWIPSVLVLSASCLKGSYPYKGHIIRGIYVLSCQVAPWL